MRRQANDSGHTEQHVHDDELDRLSGNGSACETGRCQSPQSADTNTADRQPRPSPSLVHVRVERSSERDLLEQEGGGEVQRGVLQRRRQRCARTDSGAPVATWTAV